MTAWLLAAFLGGACGREPEAQSPLEADSSRGVQRSEGVRVVETTLGRPSWILAADEALYHEKEARFDLRVLEVTFFGTEGETTSVLTARRGEVDQKARHLVAREDVVVATPEGDRLETELLEWDNAREKILSDQPVRITQGRNVYTGVGLVSDPGLSEFEILRDFRGTVVEEGEEGRRGGDSG